MLKKLRKHLSLEWLLFRARVSRHVDKRSRQVAWLLPRRVVMWCYLRVAAYATTDGVCNSTPVPEVTMMDALNCWTTDHGL